MTGGERLTARLMRQDYSEFDPQFKVMVSGNHCPRLSSVGEAVRRRVHLIPFRVVIPAEERDQRLTEKLRKEWPSILGWMLSGCMDWQKSGLHVPQAVKDATDDYLNGEDKTGLWLDERCDVDRNSSAGATAAWHDYKQWCEELNEQPGSQRTFSQELHSRGFIKTHTRTGNSFQGLCLKSDMPEVSR
jgi:putative DNA primase/helicase